VSPRRIIGIDLGTTYSLVAITDEHGARVLPNALGELLTPSAVSIDEAGAVLVGAAARARATTHPERTALSFKRDMGSDRTIDLAGRRFTAPTLSALVLATLKRDAEEALGHPVDEAVVTVPAYFGDAQRQATREAGALAGLKVERIINEPTAAALAYGMHERHREAKIVVLDLGGGTFDVTVLEIIEGVIEIQSTAGDMRLGGDDFDAAIAELLRQRAEQAGFSFPTDRHRARLLAAAEEAKRRLSDATETNVALADLGGPAGAEGFATTLTRLDAEAAWAPLIERVRAPIARALRDAKLSASQIDEVLLVGGSTRMPFVARLASQLFGRLPLRKLPPDEAVALGASVQAALKENHAAVEDLVVTDVAPYSMGIAIAEQMHGQSVTGIFSPILERGTVIPASRERRYYTTKPGQREIKLEVFQGEHALCRDNQPIGEWKITGFPEGSTEVEAVDVRFTYDLNGILEIDTRIVTTGRMANIVVQRGVGALGPEKLAEARAAMARLKLHPRDALPNTTAIARAEAAYAASTGSARAWIGEALTGFRLALESQEQAAIDAARARLQATLATISEPRR
jgi:molecular chaperone HscC